MSIKLYDLCGADRNKRFSPPCWRAKLALAHKGVAFETVPTAFTEISKIGDGTVKTVPYLADGGEEVRDSFDIAVYLDRKYPDAPALFASESEIATAQFVKAWANTALHPIIAGLVIKNIHDVLDTPDREYFRSSREAIFKKTLEEIQTGREEKIAALSQALTPLRTMLKDQPFIAGKEPRFADYIVFGSLKWLMSIADFEPIAADDPVLAWFEAIDGRYFGV